MQKPATVKMLKKAVDSKQAPEDEFKLNGEAILNVTVVGKVIEASRKAAYIMYKVRREQACATSRCGASLIPWRSWRRSVRMFAYTVV